MPAQPLTPPQLEDAARLKRIFVSWQQHRKDAGAAASQEYATEALGFNQSSLSQYLNGKIPLNIAAAVKFASGLGCTIAEFSPAIAAEIIQAMSYVGAAPGATGNDDATLHMLKPVEVHIVTRYRLTDKGGRADILDTVNTVPVSGESVTKLVVVPARDKKGDA